MPLLSNRWEYFLLSIISWKISSFAGKEFFQASSQLWCSTKSFNTLYEFILVSATTDSTVAYEICPLLVVYIVLKLDLHDTV